MRDERLQATDSRSFMNHKQNKNKENYKYIMGYLIEIKDHE